MAGTTVPAFARVLWPTVAPEDEGRVGVLRGGRGIEGPPTRLPPHEDLEARIAHPLAAIAGELHAIREALAPAAGTPFSLPNGGVCDGGGNGRVTYDGPKPGNVWRVELIVVSVTGASAAGSVEAYVDTLDEVNLGGFLPNLSGNNPARGFLAPPTPVVVFGGQPFVVQVLGAAAAAQITCRIQGESQAIGGE